MSRRDDLARAEISILRGLNRAAAAASDLGDANALKRCRFVRRLWLQLRREEQHEQALELRAQAVDALPVSPRSDPPASVTALPGRSVRILHPDHNTVQ